MISPTPIERLPSMFTEIIIAAAYTQTCQVSINVSTSSNARFRAEVEFCAASAARVGSFRRSYGRCGIGPKASYSGRGTPLAALQVLTSTSNVPSRK